MPHSLADDRNHSSLKLLRPRQLAERLGVHLTTLWRWEKAGRFPTPYRIGEHAVGYDETEIRAWLASRRPGPQHAEASL